MKLYVVATSQKEANELARDLGHISMRFAEEHLAEVKAPPTDPYYAAQYRIFTVEVTK